MGNQHTSEDLVQEVFLRILKYRHTYRGEGKFTTWLFQIARNAQYDFFRKNRHQMEQLDGTVPLKNDDLNPEEQIEQENINSILKKALKKLSPEKREVIILSRFHNLSYEEIGKIINCKVGTIKARVFRALKDLTKIYNELTGENAL